jgi:TP901 family phage tail tape measure protein
LTFEEFVAGAGEVVPTAAALGVGFNEVSASVATITSQGVKAPQAFTKLNQLMIELQKPGTELAKVMKNVTVTIDGVPQALTASNIGGAIKAQGLTKTLQDIEEAARASGKSMTQVFSSSEASAAGLLLTGKNAEFANKMLKNLNDEVAKGAANAAFEVANTSIENQFKLLKNNLQAALQPIFADILPIIGELAKQIVVIFQTPEIKEAFKSLTVIISTLLKTVVPPLMNVLAPLLQVF